MFELLAVIIGIYGVIVAAIFILQRQMIYHPGGPLASPEVAGLAEMKPVEITTKDGLTLTSWYKPAEGEKPTMVFFQGNAGGIDDRGHKVRPYLDAGLGMLLVGYRGYGNNPGSPSEQGLYTDGRANLNFLAGQKVPPGKWVLYGESLGTGVAVQLAFEWAKTTPLGAVVLDSPYTSLGDAAQSHYPFIPARLLVRDRFQSVDKIAAINSPLFLFHGELDTIIPITQGRALFQAASQPKESLWIEGGGHNNLHEFGVAGKVLEFIAAKVSR